MSQTNDRWDHAWGYRDTQFELGPDGHVRLSGRRYEISGVPMPGFLPFCEDTLGVKVDTKDLLEEVPLVVSPPNKNAAFCEAVEKEFPYDFSYDDRVRAVCSHGQATGDEVFQALYGHLPRVVDMVFQCRSELAAQRVVELASEYDVCLIPYGGGTNVTGCLTLPKAETRMIVAVDMRPMDKIEWILLRLVKPACRRESRARNSSGNCVKKGSRAGTNRIAKSFRLSAVGFQPMQAV